MAKNIVQRNRIVFFLMITIVPLLLFSISDVQAPSLGVIDVDKTVVPSIGITTGDLFLTASLFAGFISLWVFLLKKRI